MKITEIDPNREYIVNVAEQKKIRNEKIKQLEKEVRNLWIYILFINIFLAITFIKVFIV